ncbi:MAG: hypothetical protein WC859_04865 [Elusimicrobiota bacterium]|jgi:predicted transcriptional regulator
MKVKRVLISIKSTEQGLKEFAQTLTALQKGRIPKKRRGVYFVTLEAMRRVLTPKRLALLRVIRESHPNSIYELAGLVKRDIKNIQHDISLLARVGLVSLNKKAAPRETVVPSVGYDNLQLHIPVI